ncbi:MAG: RAP domain-containing protein [Promethearchaeia archaeon]
MAGYKLVSVPYWEWDVLKTAADRAEYLRARIPEYTNL